MNSPSRDHAPATCALRPQEPQSPGSEPSVSADHDRALAFVKRWLSEPYDPDQHPEWLNLARAYAEIARRSSAGKPEPNPEWEAKADAAHEAIRAEVGDGNPFDALTMLETWKAHAEPADSDGRITFSRSLLDSAQDALRQALELARTEHLQAKRNFVTGAQECREMMARFVEQGDGPIRGGPHVLIAQSIRANWNPEWGPDPGRPRNMRDDGWLGPDLHDKAEALIARTNPTSAEPADAPPQSGVISALATEEP
jgi:hypothetical protein